MAEDELEYFIEHKDKKYLFAFLDILAYSSKVRVKSAQDDIGDFIADIIAIEEDYVPKALEIVRNKQGRVSQVKTLIFSDSFCLYWEIGDYDETEKNISKEEFQTLFEDVIDFISDIQNRSLIVNILFRGAFSIGRHYEHNNVTVSEALVKAHDAEGYTIKGPRIGIDLSKDNEYITEPEFVQNMLDSGRMKQDGDILYIDYLQMFRRINTWHPWNKAVERMMVSNNKNAYYENIKLIEEDTFIVPERKVTIISKYEWLKGYHNGKCEELGYHDLLID